MNEPNNLQVIICVIVKYSWPQLNSTKTRYIWLGTRQHLAKLDFSAIASNFPQIGKMW